MTTPAMTTAPRTRRRVTTALAGGTLLVGLLLGGCAPAGSDQVAAGASASASAQTPQEALAAAAQSLADSRSVTVRVAATAAGVSATVEGTLQKAADGTSGSAAADVTVTVAGRAPARVLLVDGTLYVQQAELSSLLGKPWASLALPTTSGPAPGGLGSDAAAELGAALARATDLTVVGTESVGGVEATHYTGTVRLGDLLAGATQLPAAVQQQLSGLLQRSGTSTVRVDVWVGTDGRPVRASARTDTTFGPVEVVVDVVAYDRELRVQAPPAGQTADLSALKGSGLGALLGPGGLSGLLGGAGG